MKVSVKQCCVRRDDDVRFDAGVGDTVLLRCTDGKYFEASIKTVMSNEALIVSYMDGANEIDKIISVLEVEALMLGD